MTELMSEEELDAKRTEEISKLFKDFKTETEKRQVSSSENFDKSVLTYSSWALGISMAFLKDFVPILQAHFPLSLYLSWISFAFAIALTTTSFLVSYKGLEVSLDHAIKYYLEDNEEYFNKDNFYNNVVKWFNRASAIFFLFGLVLTIIFVSVNLETASLMKSKTTSNIALEGLPAAMMTKTVQSNNQLTKGLPTATMQKIPPASSNSSSSKPALTNPPAKQSK